MYNLTKYSLLTFVLILIFQKHANFFNLKTEDKLPHQKYIMKIKNIYIGNLKFLFNLRFNMTFSKHFRPFS